MTKVVQLSEEAYGLLKNLKREGESFSDVVVRLTRKGDLRALHKVVTTKEARDMERSIRDIDKLDRP
jgi:predicted CopG family antitoxin